MEPEILILIEVSQKEKDRYHVILYVESKISTDEPIYKTDSQKDMNCILVVGKGQGEGGGSGMDWQFRVSICKLLHLEWVENEVLMYSTGSYIAITCSGT